MGRDSERNRGYGENIQLMLTATLHNHKLVFGKRLLHLRENRKRSPGKNE